MHTKGKELAFSSLIACALILIAPIQGQAQFSDTTPPRLFGLSFSPTAVDVSTGPRTVTVTLNVTDDLTGAVGFASGSFISPSATQSQSFFSSRISGDPLNGTYQGSLTIPQFSEAGVWQTFSISLTDLAGNRATLSKAVIQAAGFPTDLTVISSPEDRNAPSVTNIAFSPTSIDVSAGPQPVSLTLHLTDDLSGAVFPPNIFGLMFRITSPSGAQDRFVVNRDLTLVAGNHRCGDV